MGRRIRVVVRLRPGEGGPSCVDVDAENKNNLVVADLSGTHAGSAPRGFHVDQVVSEACGNDELFRDLVLGRIASSADEPDTSCFLAYGHTNSGKTHSIAGTGKEPGLLTLSAKAVLDAHGVAEVAMLEVYGESVHDLLAEGERRLIRRRSGPDGTVIVVENLTSCCLSSMEEWNAVSEFGMQTRRTAPTERNARSSRSHAIFTIKSRGMRLCLVDLAGSERQTTYSPQLNKESIAINKSLSRLSTVLEALSTARLNSDGTSSYVNFRDTTLTVLLQRYLSGASMTVFLACIHPNTAFYHETMSTMRYTQRLKRIHTKTAPRKPSEDMSLFHPGERQNLLAELMLLRRIVVRQQGQQQETSQYDNEFRNGGEEMAVDRLLLDPRPVSLLREQDPDPRENVSMSPAPSAAHRQRLLRSKDTMRVAGWLLSRILGELPELSVGFDDYFDSYLPPQVQVVGYVSLMACLAPRDLGEAMTSLALLDVGDIAMGLSMLDAGIPACVGLHRLSCRGTNTWEAHEYDGVNRVFVLAFFEVNEHLVEVMGDTHDAFECCGGVLTLEPLVPLAIVFCTPLDASDELKENILQHLVTLQGEQDGAFESSVGGSSPMSQFTQRENSLHALVEHPKLVSLEALGQWRDACVKRVTSSSDTELSPAAPLAEEIERQAMNKSQFCSPFQEPPSVDSGEVLLPKKPIESPIDRETHGILASPSFFLPESSTDSSVISGSRLSLPSPEVAGKEQAPESPSVDLPLDGSDLSESDTETETLTSESIDGEEHGVNKVDVSVSPADVRVEVNSGTAVPRPQQSTLRPIEEPPRNAFIPQGQCNGEDNTGVAKNPTTPFVRPLAKEVVSDAADKKKRRHFHRNRGPVLQGCHGCAVL
ncbi:putative Unc104-like kinesin [Trypanosoma conorhini]|uniref:Putative Unc104-like kinesin n=1 Tax=Trypanosoma conorhini TaxID=83891 RepID=A0A422PWW7_9TRYP|nr:putative Unc104-like kinesin [Trypanosoma conorhini]RNF22230.1 putative Unc104-like kinesin [Trypanosoma conorhini]